jgi:putative FmdB family regulatory protein
MPTYEYACNACGRHFDVVQSFKDEALVTCSECGGALRKVFAPVGIVLKGSGFYKTDARSSNGSRSKNGKSDTPKGDVASSSADTGSGDGSSGSSNAREGTGNAKESKGTGGSSAASKAASST